MFSWICICVPHLLVYKPCERVNLLTFLGSVFIGKMKLDGRFVSCFAVLAICNSGWSGGLLYTDLLVGVSNPQLASSFQGLLVLSLKHFINVK